MENHLPQRHPLLFEDAHETVAFPQKHALGDVVEPTAVISPDPDTYRNLETRDAGRLNVQVNDVDTDVNTGPKEDASGDNDASRCERGERGDDDNQADLNDDFDRRTLNDNRTQRRQLLEQDRLERQARRR